MPFGFGQFDFSEVLRLLKSEGPINFEVARQVSTWVALEGEDEPAVDAAHAELLGELTRTSLMHVSALTNLGAGLEVHPRTVGRGVFAHETLDALAPVLTALAERVTVVTADTDGALPDGAFPDGMPEGLLDDLPEGFPEELAAGLAGAGLGDLSNLLTAMAPLLLGVQAGFMVGHLASLSLGRHEMPLPLATAPTVMFVGANLASFEADWELPHDELSFYVALHEVVYAAMLSVPWLHERVVALARDYVSAFEVDSRLVEEHFAGLDPADPESFQRAFGDPTELLGAMRTPAQDWIRERITLVTSVLEGYADYVLGEIGPPLIPSFDRIREASHRHRVERGEAAKFLETLLGFGSERAHLEQGAAFCHGVVERAGPDGLARLFEDEAHLPTAAEITAPGLWLERIDLPRE